MFVAIRRRPLRSCLALHLRSSAEIFNGFNAIKYQTFYEEKEGVTSVSTCFIMLCLDLSDPVFFHSLEFARLSLKGPGFASVLEEVQVQH